MPNHLAQTSVRDRLARCVLAFAPRSALDSRRAGWVPTGTPRFPRSGGVVLGGNPDYLLKALTGQLAALEYLSIVVDFVPAFPYDSGSTHSFFGTNGDAYYLRKDVSGNIQIDLGGTGLTDIDDSTYMDIWRPNERNVFTLSADGKLGENNAWLNGEQVMTGEATVWTPSSEASMAIGAATVPWAYFPGQITTLRFYHARLTEADHRAVWRRAA